MAYRFPSHNYGNSSQYMIVPPLSIPRKQTLSPSSKTNGTPNKHSSTSPLSNRATSAKNHSTRYWIKLKLGFSVGSQPSAKVSIAHSLKVIRNIGEGPSIDTRVIDNTLLSMVLEMR